MVAGLFLGLGLGFFFCFCIACILILPEPFPELCSLCSDSVKDSYLTVTGQTYLPVQYLFLCVVAAAFLCSKVTDILGKIYISLAVCISQVHFSILDIGIVQQDVYLFSGTVRENIAYAKKDATDEEIKNAARLAGAHEFIESLPNGYDTYIGERGIKLSGGQKQRISIARVFLKNPPVLILDEATSALDNESERLVQKSLEALAKGRTTFTIAHRLTTIKNADRIIVLTENGIEETGTHAQLIEKGGKYAMMYKMYNN